MFINYFVSFLQRLPTTKPKTIEGFENVDSANSKINLSNL